MVLDHPATSIFASPPPPPAPVMVVLQHTDLPPAPKPQAVLAHLDLPSRSSKRENSIPPRFHPFPRPSSIARATSTPLSEPSRSPTADIFEIEDMEDFEVVAGPTTTTAGSSNDSAARASNTQAATASKPKSSTPALIPRPTGAQLALTSCDAVPEKAEIRARIAVLAPSLLNTRVTYTNQREEDTAALKKQICDEFPVLATYEEHWPFSVFVTAWLRSEKKKTTNKR
ncbi:hypothetical protein R3P38DRAFT_3219030 [Favolaschia claudopus]|uniref:Uncharacterized protein n=1 Tax=Favolaschia claudopus TaxID=2862362 RepID=A0AAW0A2E2_9AGAR